MKSRETKVLAEARDCQVAFLEIRRLVKERVQNGVEFEQALREEVRAQLTDAPLPCVFHFKFKASSGDVRTHHTTSVDEALQQWISERARLGITKAQRAFLHERLQMKQGRQEADERSREILNRLAGDPPTSQDAVEVLRLWGFSRNTGRNNVIPEGCKWVHSDTFGLIRRRGSRSTAIRLAQGTARHPHFLKLLCSWLKGRPLPASGALPPWTTITINCGYAARRHRDARNLGPSIILGAGNFEDGRLRYWRNDSGRANVECLRTEDAELLDVSDAPVVFDGNRAHEVESFQGERFSIIFWTLGEYERAREEDRATLQDEIGVEWPSKDSLRSAASRFGCANLDWRDFRLGQKPRPPAKTRRGRIPAEIVEPPGTKWYSVQGKPNLGLNLQKGRVYSEHDLTRRCRGNEGKLIKLRRCFEDPIVFLEVDAPQAAREQEALKSEPQAGGEAAKPPLAVASTHHVRRRCWKKQHVLHVES